MSRMKFVMTTKKMVRATERVKSVSFPVVLWYLILTRSAGEGVDEEAADEPTNETDDGSERDGGGRLA